MSLSWDVEKIVRGIAIEANVQVADLDQLAPVLGEVWEKCVELSRQLSDGKFSTLVEIWPDTGRLVYRLSDDREFARVILSVSCIESIYHKFPEDDSEFDIAYANLVERLRNEIGNSLTVEPNLDEFIVRDSDDEKSQQNARIAT
jgi:hypothetical protein